MGEIKIILGLLLCLALQIGKGQNLPKEMSLNETFCDLKNVTILCENDEIIAVDSVEFYYHIDCVNACCSFNETHITAGADGNDMSTIRRNCSGRMNCSPDISGIRDFGSNRTHHPSYAVLQYYCIPGNRTTSICANETLESNGLPLYFTNKNYPTVTTGIDTCSCSIEVVSCSSTILLSILDLDLYHEQETCEQNIELMNGTDDLLEKLHCGDFNINGLNISELRTHYVKINFINNSTQTEEGLFLIGFSASEDNVSFRLSCPFQRETVCMQCDDTVYIPNGKIDLHNVDNTREGALANITCNSGYEPDKSTIKCLNTGVWENATCIPIECDDIINPANGDIKLNDENNTRKGAIANVTCDRGYVPDKLTISCLETGYWENATCYPIDCGVVPDVQNGRYELMKKENTTFGAMATIICNEGYKYVKDSITCGDTGEWSTSECIAKDCGNVEQIDNGNVSLQTASTKYRDVATVFCNTGYTASRSSIKCLGTGKWEKATCNLKDCGTPPSIQYGRVILNEESKTTYKSTAEVKCREGYQPKKEMIKCEETGIWETSSCKHVPEKEEAGSNTGTIIAAVFVSVLLIGLIVLGIVCFRRYRRQGYLISSIGGHERVSFKNKEVLPEDDQGQSTNLMFANETDYQEEQQKLDSTEPQSNNESQEMANKSEDTNIVPTKAEQIMTSNENDMKKDVEQGSKETLESKDENVTRKEASGNDDHKEDDKCQETSETNETSMTNENEIVKGQESSITDAIINNAAKDGVNDNQLGETSQVGTDDTQEIIKDQEAAETSEVKKADDQQEVEKCQESKEDNRENKMIENEDTITQKSAEISQGDTVVQKGDGEQKDSNTNEGKKSDDSKDDKEVQALNITSPSSEESYESDE